MRRATMNLAAACRNWAPVALVAGIACASGAATGEVPPAVSNNETARAIELRVVARKPEGGVRTVRAALGESLVLRIRADEEMTIHLHGYDLQQRVVAGREERMPLVARWVGRFPVTAHLHEAKAGKHGAEPTLLYLEVHPE
ncbi:MAG: hypothetical protein ABI789_04590 [Usitatibacter sp.]